MGRDEFKMTLRDKISVAFDNWWEEKFTPWYWNRKPHHVRCVICDETMNSRDQKWSPEMAGWKQTKDGWWICHSCLFHRNFVPFMRAVDYAEDDAWIEALKEPREYKCPNCGTIFDADRHRYKG